MSLYSNYILIFNRILKRTPGIKLEKGRNNGGRGTPILKHKILIIKRKWYYNLKDNQFEKGVV